MVAPLERPRAHLRAPSNFDGVHLGHQHVIRRTRQFAEESRLRQVGDFAAGTLKPGTSTPGHHGKGAQAHPDIGISVR